MVQEGSGARRGHIPCAGGGELLYRPCTGGMHAIKHVASGGLMRLTTCLERELRPLTRSSQRARKADPRPPMQMFAILALTRLDEAAAPEPAMHRANMSGGIPAPPASYIPPTGASFLTLDPTHPPVAPIPFLIIQGAVHSSTGAGVRGVAQDAPLELWMGHWEEEEDSAGRCWSTGSGCCGGRG